MILTVATVLRCDVEGLDDDSERHRAVDEGLVDLGTKPFRDKRRPNEHEEREREHFDGGVLGHKVANPVCSEQHRDRRDDDRDDHDRETVGHSDGHTNRRDDAVDREDDVENEDLADNRRERLCSLVARVGLAFFAFKVFVDFGDRLVNKKDSAGDQDEVATRKVEITEGQNVFVQLDDPICPE
ncbi:unannotated protein [freshwater metagenome]|uniref:Unannotated protein n=1 Tax=freshwater metagenome TaxID=449393 RepID=A0A6J6FFN9_9ZZZZ